MSEITVPIGNLGTLMRFYLHVPILRTELEVFSLLRISHIIIVDFFEVQ